MREEKKLKERKDVKMRKEEMKPSSEGAMKLPEPKAPYGLLFDLVYDAGKTQLLKHAINFKVFNYLSQPISAEMVAQKLETKPEPTSSLLDMLVILGVIEKRHGQYVNAPLAEEYLVEGKSTYMGDFYAGSIDMYEGPMAQLPQILKSGFPEKAAGQVFSEDFWASQTDMGARSQRALWTDTALPIIIELPEFPSFKQMVDLAGGAGIYTVALVSRHPRLKATVFDQPPVIKTTKRIITEYGLEDRISVLAGDFTKDDIGKDYDLVLTSDTLNFFPDKDKLEEICNKVYNSMNSGGLFISQQTMVISKNRTWPLDTSWLSHLMAFGGMDCTLYETDVSEAMLRAGFRSVESRYIPYTHGTSRVDIARK